MALNFAAYQIQYASPDNSYYYTLKVIVQLIQHIYYGISDKYIQ